MGYCVNNLTSNDSQYLTIHQQVVGEIEMPQSFGLSVISFISVLEISFQTNKPARVQLIQQFVGTGLFILLKGLKNGVDKFSRMFFDEYGNKGMRQDIGCALILKSAGIKLLAVEPDKGFKIDFTQHEHGSDFSFVIFGHNVLGAFLPYSVVFKIFTNSFIEPYWQLALQYRFEEEMTHLMIEGR